MGVIKGKDIIDKDVGNDKLRDQYTIRQDLTQGNLEVTIEDLNLILILEYRTTETARLGMRTITGSQSYSINRSTIYDIVSPEGYVNDNLTLTETVIYTVDDTVYTNSKDITEIEISSGDVWYLVKYFCTRNGVGGKMRIEKQ